MNFNNKRWDEDEKLRDRGLPLPEEDNSADEDDGERCRYCGSSTWVQISDSEPDAYWCVKCGAKFAVQNPSRYLEQEIYHSIEIQLLQIRFHAIGVVASPTPQSNKLTPIYMKKNWKTSKGPDF